MVVVDFDVGLRNLDLVMGRNDGLCSTSSMCAGVAKTLASPDSRQRLENFAASGIPDQTRTR